MAKGSVNIPQNGGNGIATINGNNNADQTIAGGTGISVNSSGGTTTISASGSGEVLSVNSLDGAVVISGDGSTASVSTGSTLVIHSITTWGSIAGSLADQTDLQSALDAKADLSNGSQSILAGDIAAAMYSYPGMQYSTAGSGSEVIANSVSYYIRQPATTLLAATIAMPTTPVDGQQLTIAGGNTTGGCITTLTLVASGMDTITGALATLAQNGFATYLYRAADTNWYRVG